MKFYLPIFLTLGVIYLIIANAVASEPKFSNGQKIEFKVGNFLFGACSGKGKIDTSYASENEQYVYQIETPELETLCPTFVLRYENDIEATK